MSQRTLIKGAGAVLLVNILLLLFIVFTGDEESEPEPQENEEETVEVVETSSWPEHSVIGSSVEGRDIEHFLFTPEGWSDGDPHLVLVGGIHGGYEWNSVLLAYEMIDLFEDAPEDLPSDVRISIIPSLNPDGVVEIVGEEGRFDPDEIAFPANTAPGRFNANGIDLNRNFACKWEPTSMWRDQVIDAGSEPFSEPEARAFRDFVGEYDISAAVFWHSQAGAVYGSQCEDGLLPETLDVLYAYAEGSGYPAVESFDHYEVTGHATGWLATLGIPGITVEFTTHEDMEWEKNRGGTQAIIEHLSSEE